MDKILEDNIQDLKNPLDIGYSEPTTNKKDNGWDRILLILKSKWYYLVAFMIPWLIAFVYGYINNVWPIGADSLLEGDLQLQYVELYYELWNKVRAGESFFYSWNAMGGYDFLVNAFYYLVSPFSLIILLLPKNMIVSGVQFIMFLKVSCVCVSMVYFFMHTKYNTLKERKEWISLFLGLAFGISNGMIYFMKFFNWLDAMIIFPFLLLGVEKMVENKSWKRYCLLLALSIMTNYYIMIQVCLFLILWFFVQLDKETTERVKKFFLFAGSSILAALMAMIVILPSALSVYSRESTDMSYVIGIYMRTIQNSLTDIINSFFIMQPISSSDFAPNIYFSVVGVFLVMLFVFIKMKTSKKAYIISIAVLLTASLSFGFLNIIWHAFTVPTGVYNRFANIYIFILLFMLLHVFVHLKEIRLRHIAGAGVTGLVAFVVTFFNSTVFQAFYVYLITILLVVLCTILLVLHRKKSISYSNILVTFAVIGMIELFVNACTGLDSLHSGGFWDMEGNSEVVELSEDIELELGERVSYLSSYENMGMVSNLPVDAGFLSCGNGNMIRLHRRFGMDFGSNVLFGYSGGSPLLNLMFNISYGVGTSPMHFSDIEELKEKNGFYLYKMNRLAGLGYMVHSDVLEWDATQGLPFELQNSFVEKAVGTDAIFEIVKPDIEATVVDGQLDYDVDSLEIQGIYAYQSVIRYNDERDSIQLQFEVKENQDLYVVRYSSMEMYARVYIDGELLLEDPGTSGQQTIHIGNVKEGQKVTLVYSPTTYATLGSVYNLQCCFGAFDEEKYTSAYEAFTDSVLDVQLMEANYIRGVVNVKESGVLMTSIQAVDGFDVYVDGQECSYEVVGETFIGIPLEVGEHTVEFRYMTPGYKIAVMVSLVAIMCFVMISFAHMHHNRRTVPKQEKGERDE